MFPLDDRTVERLARMIVDIGGPYERASWQLSQLLGGAGWADVPEYDGSPRVPWLAEQMIARRDNRADIEGLLCRVCDPLEYEDGMSAAAEFAETVNDILLAEQLAVSFVGPRPVVGAVGQDGERSGFAAPENLDGRLRHLVRGECATELLVRRAHEAVLCEQAGAYTMAIIGIGSFVEGLLYSLLTERDAAIRDHGFTVNGRTVKPREAGLELMINTAHAKGWIQLDAKDFMHNVRRFRNFVHPSAELDKQPMFDEESVTLCWGPVKALLNDLERFAGAG
ncbi:MAG TPA: hypothetical protein VFW65_35895 [Pseudonocardiaceae bacterium]|nr:hypothetical protein [Pseudonocardiaceae bacterium]